MGDSDPCDMGLVTTNFRRHLSFMCSDVIVHNLVLPSDSQKCNGFIRSRKMNILHCRILEKEDITTTSIVKL